MSDYGIAWLEPVSVFEVDLQAARFDLGNRRGSWFLTAASLEYALHERFSASLRVPFAYVNYVDMDSAFGIGDLELGTKLRLFATEHGGLILSAGVGIECPTGNSEDGLGSGHFEATPFVSASSAPVENFVLYGLVSERTSFGEVGGDHHHDDEVPHEHSADEVHGSVLSPHADQEMFIRVGAAYAFGPVYVSGGSDVVVMWSGDERLGPVLLRGELGWLPAERVRLAFGVDTPVAGERRFEWRTRSAVARMF